MHNAHIRVKIKWLVFSGFDFFCLTSLICLAELNKKWSNEEKKYQTINLSFKTAISIKAEIFLLECNGNVHIIKPLKFNIKI